MVESVGGRLSTSYHPDAKTEQSFGNIDMSVSNLIILLLPPNPSCCIEAVFRTLRGKHSVCPIIVIPSERSPFRPLEWLELGAADFVIPPIRELELLPRIEWLLKHNHTSDPQVENLKERIGLTHIIGQNPAILAEIQKIPLLARCDATVLISGETGTGKEIFARAIHHLGARADRSIVPVNCGAIPTELLENELFGHERGAFTAAENKQTGLIFEADGGTLFLDEVDALPFPAQVKFLRFLQHKQYRHLGAGKSQEVNVRVIAATNIAILDAVRNGKFRQDLFYRLNVLSSRLPALRERSEDLPLLANHFLEKYAAELGGTRKTLAPGAIRKLLLYDWPGNVRELENVIEQAVLLSPHDLIRAEDLSLQEARQTVKPESFRQLKARAIEHFEKKYIRDLLIAYGGNITRASQAAQKNRRAFFELMRKYQISARAPGLAVETLPGQASTFSWTNLS
jgi:DNA-binding NtrC family response regulator